MMRCTQANGIPFGDGELADPWRVLLSGPVRVPSGPPADIREVLLRIIDASSREDWEAEAEAWTTLVPVQGSSAEDPAWYWIWRWSVARVHVCIARLKGYEIDGAQIVASREARDAESGRSTMTFDRESRTLVIEWPDGKWVAFERSEVVTVTAAGESFREAPDCWKQVRKRPSSEASTLVESLPVGVHEDEVDPPAPDEVDPPHEDEVDPPPCVACDQPAALYVGKAEEPVCESCARGPRFSRKKIRTPIKATA